MSEIERRRSQFISAVSAEAAPASLARATKLLRAGAAAEAAHDRTPRIVPVLAAPTKIRVFIDKKRAREWSHKRITVLRPDPVEVEIGGRKIPVSRWHAARAVGIVRKWDRIQQCQESRDFVTTACSVGCKVAAKISIGCGHRECPRCRKIKAKRIRRDVDRARRSLTNRARELNLNRSHRERFVTFTAPHYAATETESAERRRIRVLFSAWKTMNRWLRKHLVDQSSAPEICHYWRVFEWTEGKDDGLGHPHFHVLVHGPWIDARALKNEWQRALALASGEEREVISPDIRLVYGAKATDELVKYMVKDLSDTTHGGFVDPVVFAQVFDELIGRRCKQPSAGLGEWIRLNIKRERIVCKCCGHFVSYGFAREHDSPRPEATRAPPNFGWGDVLTKFKQLSLF